MGRQVYVYGATGVRLWGNRCTFMGNAPETLKMDSFPCIHKEKKTINIFIGVHLWGNRCTFMGKFDFDGSIPL